MFKQDIYSCNFWHMSWVVSEFLRWVFWYMILIQGRSLVIIISNIVSSFSFLYHTVCVFNIFKQLIQCSKFSSAFKKILVFVYFWKFLLSPPQVQRLFLSVESYVSAIGYITFLISVSFCSCCYFQHSFLALYQKFYVLTSFLCSCSMFTFFH